MEKKIALEVNGKDLSFTVELGDFHAFINEMDNTNKVAPAYAFVTRTVDAESRDDLKKLIKENPGLELELAGHLVEEYKPKVTVVVGKRKKSASK